MSTTDNPLADYLGRVLLTALSFVVALVAAAMAETLFYGIHLILFLICVYILIQNRRSTQWFIFVSAVIMFALSTADIALTFRIMTKELPKINDPKELELGLKYIHAKDTIFVANNFVADLILLYRCYMVWGRSKYILAGASLLVLADSVWGFLGIGTTLLSPTQASPFIPLYVWSIFGINILLTVITVGRIFWVSRIARRIVGQRQFNSYHTTVAILVESSFVYSACILTYILFPFSNLYRMVVITICMRMVAIMPTLLIVQVGLGRITRDIGNPTTMSETEARTTSVVLDTIISSMHDGDENSGPILRPRPSDEEAANPSRDFDAINLSKLKAVTFENRRPSFS